jgi:hypothetical protein
MEQHIMTRIANASDEQGLYQRRAVTLVRGNIIVSDYIIYRLLLRWGRRVAGLLDNQAYDSFFLGLIRAAGMILTLPFNCIASH